MTRDYNPYNDPLVLENPYYGPLMKQRIEAATQSLISTATKASLENALVEAEKARAEAENAWKKAWAAAEIVRLEAGKAFLKDTVLQMIEVRFPDLKEDIKKAVWPDNLEALQQLVVRINLIPNEKVMRWIFNLPDKPITD